MKIELTSTKIADLVYLRSLGLHEGEIVELHRISRRLLNHNERYCSEDMLPHTRSRLDSSTKNLKDKAMDILDMRGINYEFPGDPRCNAGIIILGEHEKQGIETRIYL